VSRVAAVDCGTNSIRLLVADVDGERVKEVDRRLTIVRLGQDVDRTGEFAADALRRTFVACDNYAALVGEHGAERIRFVATSAARDAGNADEFFAGVRSRFGVDPEIISGAEEARLSFAGATNGLTAVPAPYLVVDLGGGSTELVLGDRDGVRHAESLDMGSVRMTERHLHSDPPTDTEIAAAIADIDALLDATTVPLDRARTLIGLAGTMTTLAALALGLSEYDRDRVHHARIPGPRLLETTRRLLAETRAERTSYGVIDPGRIDVIGAGALIAERIHHRLSVGELLVSEHDILDGLVLSLA
jgi:exopolyphosphatase / guanosine-5'-triphosphate,3'-diphosphate pyrophosphatase